MTRHMLSQRPQFELGRYCIASVIQERVFPAGYCCPDAPQALAAVRHGAA